MLARLLIGDRYIDDYRNTICGSREIELIQSISRTLALGYSKSAGMMNWKTQQRKKHKKNTLPRKGKLKNKDNTDHNSIDDLMMVLTYSFLFFLIIMQKLSFGIVKTARDSKSILEQTAKDLINWVDNELTRRAKQKIGKFIMMFFCLPRWELHEKIYEMFCEKDKYMKIEKNCDRKRKEMQETLNEKIESWDVAQWSKLLESYYWYRMIKTTSWIHWLYVGIGWSICWPHIVWEDEHKWLFDFFVDKWPRMSEAKKPDWSKKTAMENFWF